MNFAETILFPRMSGEMALMEEEMNILLEVLSVALDNLSFKCNKGNVVIFGQEYARGSQNPARIWDFDYPILDVTLKDGNFRKVFPNTDDYKSEVLTNKAIGAVVDWSAYARMRTRLGLEVNTDYPRTCIWVGNAYNVLVLNTDDGRFIASSQVVEAKGKDGCMDECKWSYQNQEVVLMAIAQILAGLRPNDQRLQNGFRVLLNEMSDMYSLFLKIDEAMKTCLATSKN